MTANTTSICVKKSIVDDRVHHETGPPGSVSRRIQAYSAAEIETGAVDHEKRSASPFASTVAAMCSHSPSTEDDLEAFRPGAWVYVFCIALFRRPMIEGVAQIVLPVRRRPLFYFVRFEGEARPRLRRVLPGLYQTAPDQMLEALLDEWRSRVAPEILHEFFPHDLSASNDNGEG